MPVISRIRPTPCLRRFLTGAGLLTLAALPASAETVGKVGVDWIGNDIYIDAVSDPKVTIEAVVSPPIGKFAKPA